MAWIRLVSDEQATGRLAKTYRSAIERAGRVFGIVRAMSPAPAVLDASMQFYSRLMFAKQGLTRRQREMIAVVVSSANDCHY
ncbi:MAG: alkylhydroperoxidase family enzyme [Bacteroidia bacterium]|jgi:alkylhydroperoxidase family enzyme